MAGPSRTVPRRRTMMLMNRKPPRLEVDFGHPCHQTGRHPQFCQSVTKPDGSDDSQIQPDCNPASPGNSRGLLPRGRAVADGDPVDTLVWCKPPYGKKGSSGSAVPEDRFLTTRSGLFCHIRRAGPRICRGKSSPWKRLIAFDAGTRRKLLGTETVEAEDEIASKMRCRPGQHLLKMCLLRYRPPDPDNPTVYVVVWMDSLFEAAVGRIRARTPTTLHARIPPEIIHSCRCKSCGQPFPCRTGPISPVGSATAPWITPGTESGQVQKNCHRP